MAARCPQVVLKKNKKKTAFVARKKADAVVWMKNVLFYHQWNGCMISQTCLCCQKHDIFSDSSVKNKHFYCLKDGCTCPEAPLETTCCLTAENGCRRGLVCSAAIFPPVFRLPGSYTCRLQPPNHIMVETLIRCEWNKDVQHVSGLQKRSVVWPQRCWDKKKKMSSAAWHQSYTQSKVRRPFKQLNFQYAYAALSPEEWLQWDMCGYPD